MIFPTGPIESTVKDTAVPRLYFCSYSIHSFGTITPASSIAIVEVIMTLETSVFAQRTLCKLNDYRLTPVGSLFECNSRY